MQLTTGGKLMPKIENLEKLVSVIPINKDSTNIIFIADTALSIRDTHELASRIKETNKSDFGAICLVRGLPSEVVKVISAKDLDNA